MFTYSNTPTHTHTHTHTHQYAWRGLTCTRKLLWNVWRGNVKDEALHRTHTHTHTYTHTHTHTHWPGSGDANWSVLSISGRSRGDKTRTSAWSLTCSCFNTFLVSLETLKVNFSSAVNAASLFQKKTWVLLPLTIKWRCDSNVLTHCVSVQTQRHSFGSKLETSWWTEWSVWQLKRQMIPSGVGGDQKRS